MRYVAAKSAARSTRRGMTLIEVVIIVSAVAALLGVCAVSIQLLMRLNADIQARYRAAVAVERLGRQIRDDAHESQTAEVGGGDQKLGKPTTLRLVPGPDRVINYNFGDGGVIRTESHANKVVRHEAFMLPRGSSAHFELRDEGPRRLVALVMTRSPGKSQADPPRPLEVVATQGKDRFGPLEKQGAKP